MKACIAYLLLFIKSIIFWIRFGQVSIRIIDSIDGRPCEYEFYDRKGRSAGYWAYGYYQLHDFNFRIGVDGTQYLFQKVKFPPQGR